jgi:crotonobetainyl-CoA:carnitine CoA-transferase CaiB-like acyl-CoA transferase
MRDGADLRIAATVALVALALLLRRQATDTGGDFVSLSASESCARFIGETFVELARGGVEYVRNTNQDPIFCPNNAYPCKDPDSWVAISVRDDADWQALRRVVGRPELDDGRFATVEGRRRHEAELDRLIGAWSAGFVAQQLAELLQQAGVPASPTMDARMVFNDEELRDAGFLPEVEHRYLGRRAVIGVPWEFTRLHAQIDGAAPLLGESNTYVYEQVLGVDPERIAELKQQGVL